MKHATNPFEKTSSPASRERSGFDLFLYFLMGFGVLLVVAAMVGLYLLFKTETGSKLVRGVKEISTVAREGFSAPGSEELRALGCENVFVASSERIVGAFGEFGPDAVPQEPEPERKDVLIVVCGSSGGAAPGCSEVAAAYGAAVDAPAEFAVSVTDNRLYRKKKICEGLYSPSGERLGDIERSEDEESR